MSVDDSTVRRIARLARIALREEEVPVLRGELNAILGFVEQLNALDVEGVPPMTSVIPLRAALREDVVTAGDQAAEVLANAPQQEDGFFVVPKVVE